VNLQREPEIVTWVQRGTDRPSDHELRRRVERLPRGTAVALCTYKRPASVTRFLDSLAAQGPPPDQLIIVDASPDATTESAVLARADIDQLAGSVLYVRVCGARRGLTRQRNLALQWITTDLVAFFDDDIVLLDGCLAELARLHRERPERIVGTAARLRNQAMKPTPLARLTRLVGMVSTLQPGSYCRSGVAIPWEFATAEAEFIEGQWLYATATMWKTAVARRVGFFDGFHGYALGEDVDFSLRAARWGVIGVATRAAVLHLHDPDSRPQPFVLGRMEIVNRFLIQERGLDDRTHADMLWFAYAWLLDTVLLVRDIRFRGRMRFTMSRILGRTRGAWDLVRGAGQPSLE
jgi:GT2 family glycosyltransferase